MATAFLDGPAQPPPTVALLYGKVMGNVGLEDNGGHWRRFGEAGRSGDGLEGPLGSSKTELFDHQYNVGLLLFNKKEWNLKFEELGQALSEARQLIQREQLAHLIAMSEAKKKEENLRKALAFESLRRLCTKYIMSRTE